MQSSFYLDNFINIPYGKAKTMNMVGQPLKFFDNNCSAVRCMAFDKLGVHVAQGCFDGKVKVFSPFTGKLQYVFSNSDEGVPSSVTCLKWHPINQDLFVFTTSDGTIQQRRLKDGKFESEICRPHRKDMN